MKKLLIYGFLFSMCAGTCPDAQSHPPRRIIVDIHGGGDFTSIENAIRSLPDSSLVPRTIFIRNGTYHEKIMITRSHILLEGESRDKTIITQSIARDEWRCSHPSDWGVATVNIKGNDITLENLTVINRYGLDQKTPRSIDCAAGTLTHTRVITGTGHQMALRTFGATRLRAIGVHFIAFGGDTVSPWDVTDGLFYFKDCVMEGGVDFYCPRGWAYAEDCRFLARSGVATLWHDGSANEDAKTVLKDCSFDGFDHFQLGRYHKDAQFYLIHCHFSARMADKDIYRAPSPAVIQWGRRVYYYDCHREGGDYDWFKDNLATAKGSPSPGAINASWVFKGRWDPVESNRTATVEISNPSPLNRPDELVVLKRDMLEKKLGSIPDDKYITIRAARSLLIQTDDMDGDGKWDEVAFLYSFSPRQKVRFTVRTADHPDSVKMIVKAHARLAKKEAGGRYGPGLSEEDMPAGAQANDFSKVPVPPYQVEGPIWENDKIAFRSYFDVRNGKDIFGKTTSHMVSDTLGTYGDKYYHSYDKKWGMDILKVGNSLGAGGIGVSITQNGKDSLVKLAGNAIGRTTYKMVTNGPVRSVFTMEYTGWNVAGKSYHVTEQISIWGGQYFYQDKVTVSPGLGLVTGIVNLHSKRPYELQRNHASILYTFGKQSENADYLGMGILVKDPEFEKFGKAPDSGEGLTNTYTIGFKKAVSPVMFRFFAGWEKSDPGFRDRKYFENLLLTESEKWNEPIVIDWGK